MGPREGIRRSPTAPASARLGPPARWFGRDIGALRFEFDERDPAAPRTLMRWKSARYRRTARMDRFARPWIVDLVDHLFHVSAEHFTGVLSVLCAGDRPVAAHSGSRSGAVLAAWFTAYDPELHYCSPGLMMHLRTAEAAARGGVTLVDLGRGDKDYKDWLRTREPRVGEGFATRATRWPRRTACGAGRSAGCATPSSSVRGCATRRTGCSRPSARCARPAGRTACARGETHPPHLPHPPPDGAMTADRIRPCR